MSHMNTNTYSEKADGIAHDLNNKGLQLEKLSRQAGEKVGSLASDVVGTTADYFKSSQNYVKSNPVQSLAIAAAVGAIVGGILTGLLHRKN